MAEASPQPDQQHGHDDGGANVRNERRGEQRDPPPAMRLETGGDLQAADNEQPADPRIVGADHGIGEEAGQRAQAEDADQRADGPGERGDNAAREHRRLRHAYRIKAGHGMGDRRRDQRVDDDAGADRRGRHARLGAGQRDDGRADGEAAENGRESDEQAGRQRAGADQPGIGDGVDDLEQRDDDRGGGGRDDRLHAHPEAPAGGNR